uniref:Pecanex-like protein n=1 Tax=Heterorhabditis bacteriophora TaxID=37862 RepID=A0A1I7W8G5_HETBA
MLFHLRESLGFIICNNDMIILSSYPVILLSQLLIGFGAAPLFTYGYSTIDEFDSHKRTAINMAIFMGVSTVGPALNAHFKNHYQTSLFFRKPNKKCPLVGKGLLRILNIVVVHSKLYTVFFEDVLSSSFVVEYLLLQEVVDMLDKVIVDDREVQPLDGTLSVVVWNPFFVRCYSVIKKWVVFKRREDFVKKIVNFRLARAAPILSSFLISQFDANVEQLLIGQRLVLLQSLELFCVAPLQQWPSVGRQQLLKDVSHPPHLEGSRLRYAFFETNVELYVH